MWWGAAGAKCVCACAVPRPRLPPPPPSPGRQACGCAPLARRSARGLGGASRALAPVPALPHAHVLARRTRARGPLGKGSHTSQKDLDLERQAAAAAPHSPWGAHRPHRRGGGTRACCGAAAPLPDCGGALWVEGGAAPATVWRSSCSSTPQIASFPRPAIHPSSNGRSVWSGSCPQTAHSVDAAGSVCGREA